MRRESQGKQRRVVEREIEEEKFKYTYNNILNLRTLDHR